MPAALAYIDDRTAGLAARTAALRSGITPGRYLRDCRQRAGMPLRSCAEKIAGHAGAFPRTEADLRALEDDQPGDYAYLIRSLEHHRVFPFDADRLRALAAATCAPGLGEWDSV